MMRLEELIPDLLRRWWIVVLAALVAGIAGYLLLPDEVDEYTASGRIAAHAEPVDYWLDLYAKNRLATYEPLINNYSFVQQALAEANLTIDPAHAQQALRVSHDASRNTLTITAIDTDPARAANIANAIQTAFIERNQEQNASLVDRVERDPDTFTPRVVLTIIEAAAAPSQPGGSDATTTVVAASMLGAIAGGVVIFFLLYRDDALRSTEDLDRYLDRPLLAIVASPRSRAER